MNKVIKLIERLKIEHQLTLDEYEYILKNHTEEDVVQISKLAGEISRANFKDKIYLRGLIEFSNYCKNNCYYCGIRAATKTTRYRLNKEQIVACADKGYSLGCRTFVLQSGEDIYYTDDMVCDIVSGLKARFPDCAVTLSIGERSHESYLAFYKAGADRFLLRHESATPEHYAMLHPDSMTLSSRMDCLNSLKEIGFQVGAGFMVGSPHQTLTHIANDLEFLASFKPQMVGIGPFIPHHETPFKNYSSGSAKLCLLLISIVRIMLPNALIPATTALNTISNEGRNQAFLSGANVYMINVTDDLFKGDYLLYDNKACLNEDPFEVKKRLEDKIHSMGLSLDVGRGDFSSSIVT